MFNGTDKIIKNQQTVKIDFSANNTLESLF